MSNDNQTSIKRLYEKIERLHTLAVVMQTMPPLEESEMLYESCSDLCLSTPMNIARIREIRRELGGAWEIDRRNNPHASSDTWYCEYLLRGTDVRLTILARAGVHGSTCRRVIDHIEQVKVYRIVCDSTPIKEAA